MREEQAQGWFKDPTLRWEQRYYSAGRPTFLVRSGNREGRDVIDPELAMRAPAPLGVGGPATRPGAPDEPSLRGDASPVRYAACRESARGAAEVAALPGVALVGLAEWAAGQPWAMGQIHRHVALAGPLFPLLGPGLGLVSGAVQVVLLRRGMAAGRSRPLLVEGPLLMPRARRLAARRVGIICLLALIGLWWPVIPAGCGALLVAWALSGALTALGCRAWEADHPGRAVLFTPGLWRRPRWYWGVRRTLP